MTTSVGTASALTDGADGTALSRFRLLRPVLEDGVSVPEVSASIGVPVPTLRRWLRLYRLHGLAGLHRRVRSDRGQRHLPPQLVSLIEGLALQKPRRSVAAVHRVACETARQQSWAEPSYATVHALVAALDPAVLLLAQDGAKAHAQRFDLLYRREATRPNQIWQADHTQLDILVQGADGDPVRPWLTVVIDDHSRAVAAYQLTISPPNALQTALALRRAIWRKAEPGWTICGIPEVLYTDHGCDFTSRHIEQVCAELKVQLIFSLVGQPRGRGRIERFFGTLNTCCLADLPGYLARGGPAPKPGLTLSGLETALQRFIVEMYNHTPHSATGHTPEARWRHGGFLPQMPASLEQLDLLLLTVARPRQVQRDGIRFQGLRYIAPTLASFVGEAVMIRYDPADMAEIRVFQGNRFICRAICQELANETVSFKDIVQARSEQRRALSTTIRDRRSLVDQLVRRPVDVLPAPPLKHTVTPPTEGAPRLRRYEHD